MSKVRFILVSAPIKESRVEARLARLRKQGFTVASIGGPPPRRPGRHALLTRRQTEILREMTSGLRTAEIAHKLHVSIKTVETHRAHLMKRLGIRSIPRLVRYALRNGLLRASWLLE
jgi:DNA-binding NarL/FixJ family response regulator